MEIFGRNLLDFMNNLLHFHSNTELKWLAETVPDSYEESEN